MARFYGRVQGNRGEATRCGNDHIKASVQSWNGSVITELTYNDNGDLMVDVSVSSGSSAYGQRIFYGTYEEYVNKLKA